MIFINLISNRQVLRFSQERQGFDGHVVDSVQVDSGDSQGDQIGKIHHHPNGPSLGH